MNDSHSPPPRPSHERAASSSSSHRINNASSDPAEPCGEGEGDNLSRDLEDAPAAGDKGFVSVRTNATHGLFLAMRRIISSKDRLAPSLHRVAGGPLKSASPSRSSATPASATEMRR